MSSGLRTLPTLFTAPSTTTKYRVTVAKTSSAAKATSAGGALGNAYGGDDDDDDRRYRDGYYRDHDGHPGRALGHKKDRWHKKHR